MPFAGLGGEHHVEWCVDFVCHMLSMLSISIWFLFGCLGDIGPVGNNTYDLFCYRFRLQGTPPRSIFFSGLVFSVDFPLIFILSGLFLRGAKRGLAVVRLVVGGLDAPKVGPFRILTTLGIIWFLFSGPWIFDRMYGWRETIPCHKTTYDQASNRHQVSGPH